MATDNQAVIPMITYEDGVAALEWLVKALGFQERARICDPATGRLMHGELEVGGGLIMLASPTPDYEGPKRHRESCERARKWSAVPWIIDGVLVQVADLNVHFAHAKASGATILSGIEEGPPGRKIPRDIVGSSSNASKPKEWITREQTETSIRLRQGLYWELQAGLSFPWCQTASSHSTVDLASIWASPF